MENDPQLLAIWTVLETEASQQKDGIHAAPTGLCVEAGDILAGVDSAGNRHLLVPLLPGEAFSPHLEGSAVQLRRIKENNTTYLSAVCLIRDLDDVFTQFAREISTGIVGSDSPARSVVEAFTSWKRLFARALTDGLLTEAQQIGLLAELQLLERVLQTDRHRSLSVWKGPDKSQHDFRTGKRAVEVKATLAREGRRVRISSVEQLNAPQNGFLALAHTRFEHDDEGDSLPRAVQRILALNVEATRFEKMLLEAGYRDKHAQSYAARRFRIVEQRFYDVQDSAFPKITTASFAGGSLPAGIESLSYIIDISNEPPLPLPEDSIRVILEGLVKAQ